LHAWRLALRLTLLAIASLLLLMFLSQKAHASDGSSEAASSRASASADASGSDAGGQSGQARAHNHRAGGPKSWFQAGKLGRLHGHKGESRSGAPADDPEPIGPPAASGSGGSTDQAPIQESAAPQVATDQGATAYDASDTSGPDPAPAPSDSAPPSDPAPTAPSDPAPAPASDPAPAAPASDPAPAPSAPASAAPAPAAPAPAPPGPGSRGPGSGPLGSGSRGGLRPGPGPRFGPGPGARFRPGAGGG
jgi:hypothetical protein